MYALYTMALALGGVGMLPRLFWRSLQGAAYHQQLGERFGRGIAASLSWPETPGCLWFHAASVGEVQGIQPIVAALHRRFPAVPIVLSTFTPAGKQIARRIIPETAAIFF